MVNNTFREKLRRLDVVGMALFIPSTTSVLIPLTWGGVSYPWSSWHTLVPLLIGAAGLIVFVIWEEKFAVEPLIPFKVMKTRSTAATYLGSFIQGIVLWGLLYYMPLYFEAVKGYRPLIAGVSLFPASFTVAPAAIVVGVLVTKTGTYRWSMWIGWALAVLGFGLQRLMTVDISVPGWIFIGIVTGLGVGLLFPGLQFGIAAPTSDKDVASAMSLLVFTRTLGNTVGVAVGGAIFQNSIKTQIASHAIIAQHAEQWSADASALVEILKAMSEGPAKQALKESYADGLKTIWLFCCVLSAIALIASFFIKHYTLDRELNAEQGFEYTTEAGDEEKK